MVTPAAERRAVAHLVEKHGMSERRACKAVRCCRMTIRYQSIRADDTALRERMRTIARERRRFGYRRLHVMLKREGLAVNHKKLFRHNPRGEALCSTLWRAQAGHRDACPHARAAASQRAVEPRLCLRPVHEWAIGLRNAIRSGLLRLPRARDRRRLHAREPGSGGRYIAIGDARCPGA